MTGYAYLQLHHRFCKLTCIYFSYFYISRINYAAHNTKLEYLFFIIGYNYNIYLVLAICYGNIKKYTTSKCAIQPSDKKSIWNTLYMGIHYHMLLDFIATSDCSFPQWYRKLLSHMWHFHSQETALIHSLTGFLYCLIWLGLQIIHNIPNY